MSDSRQPKTSPANVTSDFIFGTLATDDLRLAALKNAASGVWHSHRLSPTDPGPDEPVVITVSTGPTINATAVIVQYTTDAEPDDSSSSVKLEPAEVVWDTLLWGYRREWRGTLPAQPAGTLVRYAITAETADGQAPPTDPDSWSGQATRFAYHVDDDHVPEWLREAVIYHVFVDRFDPGQGRDWNHPETLMDPWGGTLRGVIERLPYLAELGLTCLWLSPIAPSPTHHGYDATDLTAIEPRLGTLDDFKELVAAAHDRDIKIILDFVASHISNEHPIFERALANLDSPERDWFTFGDGEEYRSFFGVGSMPQINTDYPDAREYLVDAARFWLDLGADGFRLDYANGPSHAFWSAFRAATRETEPESVTIGEIVETAELQRTYTGRLDGTLDFLLLQQMRAFFAFDAISPAAFDAFLTNHLAYFPDDYVLPSFLDNHDMNRFLWVAGGDQRRLRLAALCQFTLPHPPIIYYGTEIGLNQWRDLEYPDGSRRMEESRVPMIWGDNQDADLLDFYRRLITLRRNNSDLWSAPRAPLTVSEAGLYVVDIGDDTRRAVVALNRGAERQSVDLSEVRTPQATLTTEDDVIVTAERMHLPPLTGAISVF